MAEINPRLCAISSLPNEFAKHSTIDIVSPKFTIGRSLSNSEVIACVAISRLHCIIECTKENDKALWTIKDTSRYGIFVNGNTIKKEEDFVIKDQDVIQFDLVGDFVYKFNEKPDSGARKRKHSDTLEVCDRIQEAKDKFDSTQTIEIDNMRNKLKIAKQNYCEIVNEKAVLTIRLNEKISKLEELYQCKIRDLQGREDEIEKQKELLEKQSSEEKIQLQKEMNDKVTILEEKLLKQKSHENTLEEENKILMMRLTQEKEEFEARLLQVTSAKESQLKLLEKQLLDKEQELTKEREKMELMKLQEIEKHRTAKEQELNDLKKKMNADQENRQKQIELLQSKMDMQEHMSKEYQQEIEKMKKISDEAEKKMNEQIALRLAEQNGLEAARKDKEAEFEREKVHLENYIKEQELEKKKLQELLLQKTKQSEEELQNLQRELIEKETTVREQFEKEKEKLVLLLSKESDICNSTVKHMQQELHMAQSKNVQDDGGIHRIVTEEPAVVIDLTTMDGPSTSGSCVLLNAEIEKTNVLDNVNKIMESELQCSICSDLFIEATTLNCSHTFCKHCIERWKLKKKECPVCRRKITSECRSIVLDSFIAKMVDNMDEEVKLRRDQTLKERQDWADKATDKTGAASGERSNYNNENSSSSESDINVLFESESEDSHSYSYGFRRRTYWGGTSDYDDGSSFDNYSQSDDEEAGTHNHSSRGTQNNTGSSSPESTSGEMSRENLSEVEGLPGHFYGGYGQCYKCNHPGHWAPGCPFD